MIQIGSFLTLLGVSSMILSFVEEHSITLLFWIDNWGSTSAWIFRILLTTIGIALISLDTYKKKQESPAINRRKELV